MSRKTDSRTNQGDLDAQIAGVMMAFACEGSDVVGVQPTWYTLRVGDYLDGWRWPNGWVPGPLIQAGLVCDNIHRIARRLAWLCGNKLLERYTGRYCPPAVALTFRRPRDGVEIRSHLSRTEWRRKRRADTGGCVVAVLGRQSWRYHWELSYVGIPPGEGSPADLKDCISSILLGDDWLTDRRITTFRLTESGERWAGDLLGRNLDSGNDAAPAMADGDAPGQSPEPTPDAGPDGSDGAAAKNAEGEQDTETEPTAKIPKRAIKAYGLYRKACEALGDSTAGDYEAYVQLEVAYKAAGESADLASFDTWVRNLRTYRQLTGTQKAKCRGGRAAITGSVIRISDVDRKDLPTMLNQDPS